MKIIHFLLDHVFHLHSDREGNGHNIDLKNSSLQKLRPPQITWSESSTSSDNFENNSERFKISRFSSSLKQISRFINYHRDLQTRCFLRIASFLLCVYFVCDLSRSVSIILWIRRGRISRDCLKGEVCNSLQRKQLFWYRLLDILVATTHVMPELHVVNTLVTVAALATTMYFAFIRDIHGESSNAAILYTKLLKCYNIHGQDKHDVCSIDESVQVLDKKLRRLPDDEADFNLDFDYDDFCLKGPRVLKTRWRIRKKTLVFVDKFTSIYIFCSVLAWGSIWLGYFLLNVLFYRKMNEAGDTLDEEQLRQDFRPYALLKIILSTIGLAIKLIYQTVYYTHFVHHILCCTIFSERLFATSMQSKKISQYLINSRHIIKRLENENKFAPRSCRGKSIDEQCEFSTHLKIDPFYRQPDRIHLYPTVSYSQRSHKRMQPGCQSTTQFQSLISAALDENFRCISAVRRELEDLRLHFMPILTFELLTKIPISILYFGSIAFSKENEDTDFSTKSYTIAIGIILALLVLPLIIVTGMVQKSVSLQQDSQISYLTIFSTH